MALMCSSMEYLAMKEECPKVLITTHFIEAVEFLRGKSNNIDFLMMDFIAADEDHDEIVFLYK
jgi:DNA mismatch repair ATPase MutS